MIWSAEQGRDLWEEGVVRALGLEEKMLFRMERGRDGQQLSVLDIFGIYLGLPRLEIKDLFLRFRLDLST